MNILQAKRMRHFMRLSYPVRVVALQGGFVGDYPDLPGVRLSHPDIKALYSNLDALRREWITEQVLAEAPIPLPNSHARSDGDATPRRVRQSEAAEAEA